MRLFAIYLCIALLLAGCTAPQASQSPETTQPALCTDHTDADDNWVCDSCQTGVGVSVDFFCINDLHGKVADGDTHPGVDEMTTYLRTAMQANPHSVLLSAGDMWQGSAESNMTRGNLTTQWMNDLGFDAMTMGNHEYDWGEDAVTANAELAQFPFLAINIYDRQTDALVPYCQESLLIDQGDVQIGVIGAIGDCYSSISGDKVRDIYFKTGKELTQLVKEESTALRSQGADFIVYVLHDGLGESKGGSVSRISRQQLASYYDSTLSDGYVDLVFEGHTHQRYLLQDSYGVYHLQNGGDNKGITHAKIRINTANSNWEAEKTQLIASGNYALLEDDPIVQDLLLEYNEVIAPAMEILGTNSQERRRNELRQLVADLYYEIGVETWGDTYDIVLGGGFISVRDPGYLAAGEVRYSMLSGLFPFDNQLVLCSIRGRDLQQRFFETSNSNYFISYGTYGESVRTNIDPNATYYVVVDSYSSVYAPNNLTEIARYKENVFARDLLADYIAAGGLS